jgi:hypothetical protein
MRVGLLLLANDFATRPHRNVPLAALLTSEEFDVYRRYHIYLWFPGAGQAFSAFLNLLRFSGFVFAGLAFWVGNTSVGVALIAYFFLVAGATARLDPVRYVVGPANSGNAMASEQLVLLQSLERKRAAYNASD